MLCYYNNIVLIIFINCMLIVLNLQDLDKKQSSKKAS